MRRSVNLNKPQSLEKKWIRRKENILFLWGIYSGDLKRFIHWHFQGGKKHFETLYKEIIKKHKWCFVVGCNNSGTSLLHKLIKNTGQVSTTNREGQYYTNVLTRGNRKGYERVWTEFLNEVLMDETYRQKNVPRLLHDWMSSIQKPIREIFVDKTTLNAVRMRWLQKIFPNSYFIGVIRNGYAVVEGIKRKGNKDIVRGAKHWNLVNKIMIEDSKKINRFLLLKYEELVENRESAAKKIASFIGLKEEIILHAFDAKFEFETLAGRKKQKIRNFNQDSIAMLRKEELETIYSIAGEMIEYFNYKF